MLGTTAEDFEQDLCCRFTNLFARLNFVVLICPSYSSSRETYILHATLWIVCIIIIYVFTALLWPIIVFIVSLILCYCWKVPNIERNMTDGQIEAHFFDYEERNKSLTVSLCGQQETLTFRSSSNFFDLCYLNSFYTSNKTGECVNV